MLAEKNATTILYKGKTYKRYFMSMFLYSTFEEGYRCDGETSTDYIYFVDGKYMGLDRKEITGVKVID